MLHVLISASSRCLTNTQRLPNIQGAMVFAWRLFCLVLTTGAGKDGSYSFFSGVDASRAFITGAFSDDLNDNVEDFTDDQMAGLSQWKGFFLKVLPITVHMHCAHLGDSTAILCPYPAFLFAGISLGGCSHVCSETLLECLCSRRS
jgi:hypothetical protein